MKPRARQIAIGSLFAGLAFTLGFFKQYHVPKIENWLMMEVERYSEQNLPARIWPESLRIGFFPPSVVVRGIRILPQGELAKSLAPASIDEAEVRLSLLALLRGRLRVSQLAIRHPDVKLIAKKAAVAKPAPSLPQMANDFSLDNLNKIPVDEILLENAQVAAKLTEQNVAIKAEGFSLRLENRYQALLLQMTAPVLQFKYPGAKELLTMNIDTRVFVDNREIQVSALKIKYGDSFLVGSGRADGKLANLKPNSASMVARSQIELEDVKRLLGVLFPTLRLPDVAGQVKGEINLSQEASRPLNLQFTASATDLGVAGFHIGNVDAKGDLKGSQLHASEIQVTNNSGSAKVRNFELGLDADAKVKGELTTDNLELGALLGNLKIKNAPLRLIINAALPCQGNVSANFELKCQGIAKVKDLWVYHGPEKRTIVAVNNAQATGDLTINRKSVTYKAELAVGESSKGRSMGVIDYQTGFKIHYEGDRVHLSDVKNLVNLPLEGVAKIKGVTEGDAHWGRINMDIDAEKLWLDQYFLGNASTELQYKTGVLTFRKIVGLAGSSRYNGNLSLNLPNSEILLTAKVPYADLADLQYVLGRRVKWPFEASGSGAGEIKLWGPLKFSQLNYQLKSSFFRGTIAGESFDQFFFNLTAVDGAVKSDRIQILKAQSSVDLSGKISSEGLMDSVIVGRALRLEESEGVARIGLDTAGQVDFTMAVRGQLPQPKFDVHGRLSKMVVGDRPVDDSNFKLKILPDRLEGGGSFIGDVVNTDFVIPLTESAPFRFFVKTVGWDFAHLFSVLSRSAKQKDFSTKVTSLIDIHSDRGGLKTADGDIEISELKVRRGPVSIAAPKTIVAQFKSGVLNARNFNIEGDGGYMRVNVQDSSMNKINATVNGKLDMSLMSLITPFLADIQGKLALSVNLTGTLLAPEVAGSAFVEQGYVKFREFPHPFQNLRADVLFNRQDIVINAIKAELGGGTLTGDGKIRLLGRANIPVDVKGQFSNISLNVPENMRTRGSGSWFFRGPYLPYVIGAVYDVDNGEVTAEFSGGDLGSGKTISPSSLLPKFISQNVSQPISLDLNVNLKNPLAVRNSIVKGTVKGSLHVVGPPNAPKLSGTFAPVVPGSKIMFRDVPFDVLTGFVEFNDDPPDNPKIYLTGTTQVSETIRDDNNRETVNRYEINMLVQGRASRPQPKITLTSLPALSDKEIVSLLALGMTSTSLNTSRAGGVMATNSLQAGAAFLQKPLSNEMRKRLGLDMQINQSNATSDTPSSLNVTLSKQFTPRFSASASRTIEKNPASSAKMEYQFNKGLSVVGRWDGKETGATQLETKKDVDPSVFGLDLEYKVNFK